CSSYADSNVCF
nr:immunoglobulin light chain junction region [Macaca mulatta]